MLKKFLKKISAVGLFSAVAFANLPAQAVALSLAQSIEMALENDESIEAAEFSRENAKWSLSSAPKAEKIGGRDYHDRNEMHKRYGNKGSYVFDEYTGRYSFMSGSTAYHNTFSNSFSVSIPIYSGGRLENSIKSRKFSLNAADLSLENTKQTVKFETIQAYYNVLQQENNVNISKSAVNMANEQLNLIQIQFEEGATAYADVLQMEVQMANYKNSLTSAQCNLDVAKERLLSIIGMPSDTEIELTDDFFFVPYPQSVDACLNFALDNRPDLAEALYSVKRAEANVSAEKSGMRPSITGTASKNIVANGAFKDERSSTWEAGISLSWSIFDNQVTSANVHAAQAEVDRLKKNAEAVSKRVKLEVRNAYTQMKAAETKMNSAKVAVSQAEESYKIAQIRYEEGVDILLSVTDAQDKLTQARTNYFNALYEYNLYKSQLEKAMGLPVGLYVPIYVQAAQDGKSAQKALEAAEFSRENAIEEAARPFEERS